MANERILATRSTNREDALLDELARMTAGEQPSGRTLWLTFVDAGLRLLHVATAVEHVPVEPDRRGAENLVVIAARLLEDLPEGAGAVIVVQRDGPSRVELSDLTWSAALRGAAERTGIAVRLYLAADGAVQPVPRAAA